MTTKVVRRTAYRLNVGTTGVVFIKAVEQAVKDIASTLGYTKDADGDPPDGKVLIGEGRLDALRAGCFPVAIYYKKSANQIQRAIVLVSPEKADTAINELRGQKYNGFTIVRAGPVTRRKIVVG